jgi:exonuclease SbcD
VVTAGNHDSPSFLDAPKAILKSFHIHVVGELPEDIADEVLLLNDPQGNPELIVCAVPYLRDRDIRKSEPGESLESKEEKLREGIERHYGEVARIAQQTNAGLNRPVPIVAMGHLFTAGGQTVEGDGVRNLYVGNLAHIESNIFHECFEYVALGHLHVPQKVGGSESPVSKELKRVNLNILPNSAFGCPTQNLHGFSHHRHTNCFICFFHLRLHGERNRTCF